MAFLEKSHPLQPGPRKAYLYPKVRNGISVLENGYSYPLISHRAGVSVRYQGTVTDYDLGIIILSIVDPPTASFTRLTRRVLSASGRPPR